MAKSKKAKRKSQVIVCRGRSIKDPATGAAIRGGTVMDADHPAALKYPGLCLPYGCAKPVDVEAPEPEREVRIVEPETQDADDPTS